MARQSETPLMQLVRPVMLSSEVTLAFFSASQRSGFQFLAANGELMRTQVNERPTVITVANWDEAKRLAASNSAEFIVCYRDRKVMFRNYVTDQWMPAAVYLHPDYIAHHNEQYDYHRKEARHYEQTKIDPERLSEKSGAATRRRRKRAFERRVRLDR